MEKKERILSEKEKFSKQLYIYEAAEGIIRAKLKLLEDIFEKYGNGNAIKSIYSRIKKVDSIEKKLNKDGYEFSVQNIQEDINDVLGFRIVCVDISDVYEIVDMISNISSMKVVKTKDYIKNPKKSGYKSFHMILELPIDLPGESYKIHAEIQVRTIIMEAWASLEHEIVYKNPNCSDEAKKRLRELSYEFSLMEDEVSSIRTEEVPHLKQKILDAIKH